MAWVTWRQHRLTLAGIGTLLTAAAAYVLVTGVQLHHAYAIVKGCQPRSSDICQRVANDFASRYSTSTVATAGLLLFVPALIGAFAGAPLLAREFETGTFRYAWTQSIGRTQWTVAKLAALGALVTAAAGAFSVLFSWAYQPIIGEYGYSPLQPLMFQARGVTFAAWTLAAFTIGAFAGVGIRRVIPAIFATLAGWAALAFATGLLVRPYYQAPLVSTDPSISTPDWVIDQHWLKDGAPAPLSMIDAALHPVDVHAITLDIFQPGPGTPDNFDPVQYLVQHGFTQLTTYQPASRFWTFQWIEAGWLLALSVLLFAGTLRLVRRRAT
jgi:hypothetical protein